MAHIVHTFKTTFAGEELTVETGRTSELTNGSCWVRYGDTIVMANVTAAAKPREGIDVYKRQIICCRRKNRLIVKRKNSRSLAGKRNDPNGEGSVLRFVV